MFFVALRDFGRSDAKKFASNRKKIFGVSSTSLCVLFFIGQFVIILVINKSNFRCAVVRFCYHSYDYRSNWTPLSPITITYYAHKELSLSQWLRSAREIWTALILWKINLRAGKSWFDGPSSEKMKVSPANFLAAIFFSQMFFSLPLLQSKFEQTFWMSTQTPLLKSNSWKSFKKHEIGSNSLHFDFWWKRLHNAGLAMSKAS